jgi:delta 1-pyrroline-5-carboxylate dehydrogenase
MKIAPGTSCCRTKLTAKDAFEALESVKGKVRRQWKGLHTRVHTCQGQVNSNVKLMHHIQLFINNEWVDAKNGDKMPVIDPRTGDSVFEVAKASEEDVDAAVKAARKAFDEGPWPKMGGKVRTQDPVARKRYECSFGLARLFSCKRCPSSSSVLHP